MNRQSRSRVPVVLQMASADCGAACMTMILRYWKLDATLSACRELLGAGRDGVNALAMVRLAQLIGLTSAAYRLGDPAQLNKLNLPAISHWNGSHFVVVERVDGHHVRIVDPATGRRKVTLSAFAAARPDVVVTFTPTVKPLALPPSVQNQPSLREQLIQVARTVSRPLRHTGWALLFVSLLLQLIGLSIPAGMALVFDYVLPSRESALLPMLGWAVLGIVVIQFGLGYLRSRLLVTFQTAVDHQLMTRLFGHLLTLPFRFFAQRSSGDLMQRLASSVLLRELVSSQVLSALIDGLFVLTYLAVLAVRDITFAAVAAAIGAGHVLAVLTVQSRLARLRHQQLTVQAEAEGLLMEALTGMATVKAMGAEDRVYQNWLTQYTRALRVDAQQGRLSAVVDNVGAAVRIGAPLALLLLGASRLFAGELTLGEMLALQTLSLSVLMPLTSLVTSVQVLMSVSSHVQRLHDVFLAEPEIRPGEARTPLTLSGRIELRNVSFRYDVHSPYVLRNVDLVVEPGQKVAVVGPSGGGKSTLALLLLGLQHPTSGEVLVDGVPLDLLDPGSMRRQFGVVMQESFIFRESIRRNIALNTPEASLEDVVTAASVAALHEDVMAMPMAYETLVSERGQALSGGQRQRLAIARAVLGRPRILILDEATSHLDVATERRVDHGISDLHCTRIVIAHRLSTVRNADRIVVLEKGTISESGSHRQLLSANGTYAQLVDLAERQVHSEVASVGAGSAGPRVAR